MLRSGYLELAIAGIGLDLSYNAVIHARGGHSTADQIYEAFASLTQESRSAPSIGTLESFATRGEDGPPLLTVSVSYHAHNRNHSYY